VDYGHVQGLKIGRHASHNLTSREHPVGRDINMAGKEWEGEFDPMADPEEQRHILSVLDSFR
jgi:hypothetical protein